MSAWWGDYEVGINQTLRWQIGPKTVWITRGDVEWKVITAEGRTSPDNRIAVAEPADEPDGDDVDVKRFAVPIESETIRLRPALPDRNLVVKTRKPFFVPTGGEAMLYVSAPLWLRVYAGGEKAQLVDDSIVRPSDTWFGPDTMSGELCYALRTSARLHLENLPFRPHRAILVVHIKNNAESTLHIEKLKVPVQNLSLFTSTDGYLWTEALALYREDDTENANVQLDKRPARAGTSTRVTPPRIKMAKGFLLEAFGGIFRKGE